MSLKLYQWLLMLFLMALAGCNPQGAEYADDLSLVFTNYNAEFDFKSRTTYAIPDSVIKITGDVYNDPDGDGKPQFTFCKPVNNACPLNGNILILVSGFHFSHLHQNRS